MSLPKFKHWSEAFAPDCKFCGAWINKTQEGKPCWRCKDNRFEAKKITTSIDDLCDKLGWKKKNKK